MFFTRVIGYPLLLIPGMAEKRIGDSKLKMEHIILIFGGQIKIYSGDRKLVSFTEIAGSN